MSGIYGIIRFDGAPVDSLWTERMRAAMAHHGPDGGGSEIDGPVALGHLLMQLNPEDARERQPYRANRGRLVCAARLDNRDSLLQTFQISSPEAPQFSDGRLVSLAWDRWAEALCARIEGDWALAAWNPRERNLLLARDACGLASLYYHLGKGFLAFASSMKALLAIPAIPNEPEILSLAETLLNSYEFPELTPYKAIRRLLGGHALLLGADGQCTIRVFWSSEHREAIRYRRDEDYEEAFLHHYSRAVQSCLRSGKPMAASLSGGRDSGSVVALAAPLLAAQGRNLTAYTSVPSLPPDGASGNRIGNEWELAAETAAMAGPNVRHIAVDAAGYGVLQGIRYILDHHGAPNGAAVNHFWIQAITETAAQDGARVLLTGQLGNYTVSWRGNGSALLALRQRDPRTAMSLFLHAERDRLRTVKRQMLGPILAPIRLLLEKFHPPGIEDLGEITAIHPQIVQTNSRLRHAAVARVRNHSVIPNFHILSAFMDARQALLSARYRVAYQLWSEIAAPHQVHVLDPTTNLRLVEFLLTVPDSQFVRKGSSSSLLVRTFRGRLPERILQGNLKGLQSADIGYRILKELPAFHECLASLASLPAANQLLNLPRLNQCLRDLVTKVDPVTTSSAAEILLKGVCVGLFLERQPGPVDWA